VHPRSLEIFAALGIVDRLLAEDGEDAGGAVALPTVRSSASLISA
jgi:hypothetical protein